MNNTQNFILGASPSLHLRGSTCNKKEYDILGKHLPTGTVNTVGFSYAGWIVAKDNFNQLCLTMKVINNFVGIKLPKPEIELVKMNDSVNQESKGIVFVADESLEIPTNSEVIFKSFAAIKQEHEGEQILFVPYEDIIAIL